MGMVIFSGTITKEEILQEAYKPWYDRLVKRGRLAMTEEENCKFTYKLVTKIIGFTMLFTGLVFLFIIIYALLRNVF